jgi:dynein heavy chain
VIDSSNLEVTALEKEARELHSLADMFEFPEMMIPINELVAESRDELIMVKDVWDTSMLVELQFRYSSLTPCVGHFCNTGTVV